MYFVCSLYVFIISLYFIGSLCTALCKSGFKMCDKNKGIPYTIIITII